MEKSKKTNKKIAVTRVPTLLYIAEMLSWIDREGAHFFLQFLFTQQ